MEFATMMALVSAALAVATFFIGRISASHLAGKETGGLATDVRYIKASIDRIEKRFDDDIGRLDSRADEVSVQLTGLGQEAARAAESARSAHHRIDEHLEREHGTRGGKA